MHIQKFGESYLKLLTVQTKNNIQTRNFPALKDENAIKWQYRRKFKKNCKKIKETLKK